MLYFSAQNTENKERYNLECVDVLPECSLWISYGCPVLYHCNSIVPLLVYKTVFKRSKSSLLSTATMICNEVKLMYSLTHNLLNIDTSMLQERVMPCATKSGKLIYM